ncbi:CHAD domain-containing protein [Acuticoccus yangtzensis]|uniref:CHAD domain-containing protein n=1 Tax=Acuticoccus yangtzensis TaxID=1443441 RepID=UPI0009499C95|nr:CHAD domain-containing protein [Acuticoccus yangtzensis]
MSFQFKPTDATLQDAVRRVARSQIRRALEEAAATSDLATAVHRVRRRTKKLRGLVRLVRPGLADYGDKNATFRDAARRLSTVRDAAVLLEAFDGLADACGPRFDRAAAATVRNVLVDRRREAHADASDLADAMADFRATMAGALDDVREWTVKGKEAATVAEGVEAILRRAADDLAAVRKKPSADRLHDLRKQVKYYHAHIRLLRDLWPGPMSALADEVEALTDRLGEERDLSLLVAALKDAPLAADLVAPVVTLAEERRAALHAEAMMLAARVFADDPKVVARRIEALWKAWRRQPVDDPAADAEPETPSTGELEIERKFLVAGDDWRAAAKSSAEIEQGYIAVTGRVSVRVRIKNGKEATMTVKSSGATLSRTEIEYRIPLAKAEALMAMAEGTTIRKRRFIVPVGAATVEVDEFASPEPGLVLAEVELPRPDAPVPYAAWLGREVTGNPRYYNAAMAGVVPAAAAEEEGAP